MCSFTFKHIICNYGINACVAAYMNVMKIKVYLRNFKLFWIIFPETIRKFAVDGVQENLSLVKTDIFVNYLTRPLDLERI